LVETILMGHIAKQDRGDASAAIGGSLETMREAIITIFNNHEGVNTMTISPQSQSTRAIKYDTSDDKANEKEKDCLRAFY
jgi:hypothetical protein